MSFDISNVVPRNEYVASGSADFTVAFEYETKADVVVLLDSVTQLLDVDYTLTDPMLTGGGTCTFVIVPTNGQKVVIYRNQVTSRVTAYTTHGNLPGLTLDLDVDRLTMLVQELRRDRDRTVRIPNEDVTGATTLLPIAATRANRFLHCDSLGNIDTAELLATGTVLSGAIISSYLTPAIVGLGLWPRTADEISAGVTPTLYRYPPLDARRYGADPTASAATNATAINNAGLVAFTGGGGIVQIPAGTFSYSSSILHRPQVKWQGQGAEVTILSYTGAAQGFKSVSPGTRIFQCAMSDLSVTDAGTGTTGVELDSISKGEFHRVQINSFDRGFDVYSPAPGNSVYNRFYDCVTNNCTNGYRLRGTSSNANRFHDCRTITATGLGLEIIDSNGNSWIGGEFEGGGATGVAVQLSATGPALCFNNQIQGCRIEQYLGGGTGFNIGANVLETQIIAPLMISSITVGNELIDAGTRTSILIGAANVLPHKIISAFQNAPFYHERTANGGASLPAHHVVDSVTSAGTPVTYQATTERATGSFYRGVRGGATYYDVDATGAITGRHLATVSADRGDASQTLTVGTDSPIQRWATVLTAGRTVTLSTTGAKNGDTFRVVRTGLGAFNLDVGGLKTIVGALAAFVDVGFDGTAWRLTGYGTL